MQIHALSPSVSGFTMPPLAQSGDARPLPTASRPGDSLTLSRPMQRGTALADSEAAMLAAPLATHMSDEAQGALAALATSQGDPLAAHGGLDRERVMRLLGLLD